MATHRHEPCDDEIEAAARAIVEWQFPKRESPWEAIPEEMKNKFRDAARRALEAAHVVATAKRLAVS